MAHNFESKAAKKLVEAFYLTSRTEGIFSQDYDWTGVATVRVRSVDDLPLQDYDWDATTGSRFGNLTELGDTYQELTVNDDKAFNGSIDKRNNTSTMMEKSAGSVTARELRNVVVPYIDRYRLAAIASGHGIASGWGTNGKGTIKLSVTLSKTNALETILGHNAEMNNLLVPNDRVLFIKETEALKVKLADQIVGTGATVQDIASRIIKSGELGTLDGMHIVKIPDSWMPTNVLYMIVAKNCCVAPKKIETLRVIENHPDIDGHVVQGRILHDCFVLEKKAGGILVAKSSAA